jgi:hypothetical protein
MATHLHNEIDGKVDIGDENIDTDINITSHEKVNSNSSKFDSDKLKVIKDYSRIDRPRSNEFNIMQYSYDFNSKMKEKIIREAENNDGDDLLLNSMKTKTEVSKLFSDLFSSEKMNESTEVKLFKILLQLEIYPGVNWPKNLIPAFFILNG